MSRNKNDPDHWFDYGAFCLLIGDYGKVRLQYTESLFDWVASIRGHSAHAPDTSSGSQLLSTSVDFSFKARALSLIDRTFTRMIKNAVHFN